ncbi:nitroreductase [Dietzia alimentaria]|uniref:nitroreductase n=1 Tax=Dietzia alimentaria TaxID=665550 RepID=UPI00029AF491|nr:nitroreductase [Dietzia alimentaria]
MTHPPLEQNPTDLASLITGRSSCRAFLPESVPRETITRILDLAQQAPSWCNTQPWQVAITEGDGTERFRAGLTDHVRSSPQEPDFAFPVEYVGEYRARRKDCAMQLYSSLGIADGDRRASMEQTMKNFDLFGAPHVAVVTTDQSLGLYGAVDCGVYVNTFLLAAHSLGVATVPQAALAGCAPFLRSFFNLPDDRKVVCAISFGFADTDHPANGFRTPRADVKTVTTWAT